MTVRHRPMEPKDVGECAEIVAKHPVIGPRYGGRIKGLSAAWLRLLTCEPKCTTIYYADDGPRAPICFVGVSIFVTDDFVRELKAPPGFWMGPELVKRILRGDSPVLLESQFVEANSRGGLNLILWEGCYRSGFETNSEIHGQVMSTFIEDHAGYLLKEIISSQIESVERLRWALGAGTGLWNPLAGRYEKSFTMPLEYIVEKPHLLGATREMERTDPWNRIGSLFDYRPPRCGFSRSERRMLLTALQGGTDEELSRELNISVPTVKKTWISVYRRIDDRLPDLNPNRSEPEVEMARRGKEKKRHLLTYLRKHPEELRPVSHNLLSKPPATDRPSSKHRSPSNDWLTRLKS
jgi:DNA-binding CsgD family transcriptional regulator